MTDKYARVWSGTEWVNVSSPIASPNAVAVYQPTAPSSPVTGQIWVDSDDNASYVWNGSSWGASPNLSLYAPIASPTFTGTVTTSGQVIAGSGSGNVALTTNDAYGNANVTFNHASGTPDVSGSSARIVTSVDSTTGSIGFQVGDNVSAGVALAMPTAMTIYSANVSLGVTLNSSSFIDTTQSIRARNFSVGTGASLNNFGSGTISTDANWGMFYTANTGSAVAAHAFADSSANVRAVITSAGNVGIGTSSPDSKLTISDATSSVTPLTIDSGSGADTTRGIAMNVSGANYGRILVPSGSGGAMAFWSGTIGAASERMRITSSGNVGIGSTNPIAQFHIVTGGDGIYIDRFTSAGGGADFIGRQASGTSSSPLATTSGSFIASLGARGYGTTGFSSNSRGLVSILAGENWTDSATGTYIAMHTTANGGTTRTEKIRITGDGNVGIGTTTPTNYKLEVAGIVEADNYDIGLTTLASDSIAINFSGETGLYTRTAAGNIIFTASNYRVGSIKTVRIIPGAALRTLTFPAAWVFVGAKPASVAASKVGILTITSFGTTEADCVAAWAVQA